MSDQAVPLLDRLRQPEYTGENRCTPCTVVNVAIAAVLSAGLAALIPSLGLAAFTLSLVVIYVRGYLVPGTPELTKRYMPPWLLQYFDKHPTAEEPDLEVFDRVEYEREHAVEADEFLLSIDAIEPCEDGTAYCLTDGFAAAIRDHTDRSGAAADNRAELAAIFDVDAAEVTPRERDYPAVEVDILVRKWPSEAALVLDVATHLALAARSDEWADVPPDQRREILEDLRGFHDRCPSCAGTVEYTEDVVESCCGRHEVKTVACRDCGQRLREFDQARVGDDRSVKGMTP